MPIHDPANDRLLCRVLLDAAASGCWNMAVDESLLQSTARRSMATLRFYTWSEPTLTLGYFQRYNDRNTHMESAGCSCLRRNTGGGAILHDREITYSLTIPLSDRTVDTRPYYNLVHEALAEVLLLSGVTVNLVPTSKPLSPAPFLCFARRSVGDVVLGEYKILGSAQRRQGTVLLQHGSLLWERSRWAPELPGLTDLVEEPAEVPPSEVIIAQWSDRICRGLNRSPEVGQMDQIELAAADQLSVERFGDCHWNQRR